MTPNFTKAQLTVVAPRHACTEASQMGLRPGLWPDMVTVANDEGKRFTFHRTDRIEGGGGELGGFVYRNSEMRLDIFND